MIEVLTDAENRVYGSSQHKTLDDALCFIADWLRGCAREKMHGYVTVHSREADDECPVTVIPPDPTHDYDPNKVMENLSTDECIDVVWAVLEGGDALSLAIELTS